jgi:hypothetical protein
MKLRRISTLAFARQVAANLDGGQKLVEVLQRPMIVDILNTMDEHDAARFFVLGPVQAGKSAAGQMRLLRNHVVRQRKAGWYGPGGKFGDEFVDTKLNPAFDSIPEIQALVHKANKAKNAKKTKILVGDASHLFLSSSTEADRTSKTFCDIYRDERHLWEDGWSEQVENRRADYPREFTDTSMSTGLTAGTEAAADWGATDQRTWHCRCPACKRLFEPRYGHEDEKTGELIGGLRYEKKFRPDGLPDEVAIAATLAYECPHCHVRFPDTDGSRLLFSGTADAPRGIYVAMNAHAAERCFGWTYHAIAIRPWLPIVIRFEKAILAKQRADYEPLALFIREECAGIWNPMLAVKEQKTRPLGDYVMGEAWAAESRDLQGRLFRFCTVDVQLDHFVVVIRAWGPFSESRLIWAQKVTTPGQVADLCALHAVPKERTILDSRHATDHVRRIAGQMGWRTLMGEGSIKDYNHISLGGLRRIFSEPKPIDPWQGTGNQGQCIIFEFNFSKSSALDRLHALRTMETNDGRPLWTGAKDAPEWFWREAYAYYRFPKKHAETKVTTYNWVVSGPDHAASCEIMGTVGASMSGLVGAEALEMAGEIAAPAPTAAA